MNDFVRQVRSTVRPLVKRPAFTVLVVVTLALGIGANTAIFTMAAVVFALSIPPTINNRIFIPWDLTFGSGMQTLGALLAVITLGWCVNRSSLLQQLSRAGNGVVSPWLVHWIRFGIPSVILLVGIWWLWTSVLA